MVRDTWSLGAASGHRAGFRGDAGAGAAAQGEQGRSRGSAELWPRDGAGSRGGGLQLLRRHPGRRRGGSSALAEAFCHLTAAATTAQPHAQCSATPLPNTRAGHSNAGRQQRSDSTGTAVPRFALRAPPASRLWDGSGASLSVGCSHPGPAHADFAVYLQCSSLARGWQLGEAPFFAQRVFAAFLAAGAATDRTVAPLPGPGSPAGPPGPGTESGRPQPRSGERTRREAGRCT